LYTLAFTGVLCCQSGEYYYISFDQASRDEDDAETLKVNKHIA